MMKPPSAAPYDCVVSSHAEQGGGQAAHMPTRSNNQTALRWLLWKPVILHLLAVIKLAVKYPEQSTRHFCAGTEKWELIQL